MKQRRNRRHGVSPGASHRPRRLVITQTKQVKGDEADGFSLVIVGNMNPAIHHPSWYHMTGIITAEEAESAQGVVCTPTLSQFSSRGISILCDVQRWTASTIDVSQTDRLREMGSKTFDLLTQTPVASYSLIFNQHRSLGVDDVGAFLASLVEQLPIALTKSAGRHGALIRHIVSEPHRQLQTAIEPSVRADGLIFLGVAFEHSLRDQKGHFNLGPHLSKSFEQDTAEAHRIMASVLESLTAEAKR